MNRITVAKIVGYSIATIAAVTSYGHQVELLALAELDPLFGIIPSEWVTPATVDSLAIVALIVRTAPLATEAMKRAALLPLVLAGGLSIAANVATAHNVVGVIVGVWTVAAYILAELFISKLDGRAAQAATRPAQMAVHATATVDTPADTMTAADTPAAILSGPPVNPRTGRPYSERHARRLAAARA